MSETPDEINLETYGDGVPEECSLDIDGHREIGLCWGLLAALEAGKPMDCSHCEYREV